MKKITVVLSGEGADNFLVDILEFKNPFDFERKIN